MSLLRFSKDQLFLILLLCVLGLIIPWNGILERNHEFLLECKHRVKDHPGLIASLYVVVFITVAMLSFPGPTAIIMAILGGWLFGYAALPLSSFSSSTGASLAFLFSRYGLRDSRLFENSGRWRKLAETFQRAGWMELLFCRLNPLLPYFALNLLFARTSMSLGTFWLVTLIGMLPLTFLYVTLGNQLRFLKDYQNQTPWWFITLLCAVSSVVLMIIIRIRLRRQSR